MHRLIHTALLLAWAKSDLAKTIGSSECPEGFTAEKHGCYLVSTELGNISECQHKICAAVNGTLASICHGSLNSFLRKLVIDKALQSAWIGLFERGEDESGDWVWSDELESNFTMWAAGEPNNWCLDEDCVVLGVLGEIGVSSFDSALQGGWFDLSCSERRHCICQLEGVVSADFIEKEANMSNTSAEGTYEQCLAKAEQCWWYENKTFQYAFIVITVPCGFVAYYALFVSARIGLGFRTNPRPASIREYVGVSSLYGGLLSGREGNDASSDCFVDCWVVRGAWAEMLYAIALFLLAFSTFLHMNR